MRYAVIILFALGLAACAGSPAQLSAAQCDANWAAVGAADGGDGASIEKLAKYRNACARAGAPLSSADQAAWRDGWRGGLGGFCAETDAALSEEDARARDRLCPRAVAASSSSEPFGADEDRDHLGDDSGGYGGYGTAVRHRRHGPRIYPSVGVRVGSGGVRVGGGVGVGFGLFRLGVGF